MGKQWWQKYSELPENRCLNQDELIAAELHVEHMYPM